MQIHELTRPRRVTEASVGGALGGTAAVAGGAASALGKGLMSRAFGGADVMSKTGDAMSREQGLQDIANSPAAKTLALTMQKAWVQTIKQFLAQAKDSAGIPATKLSDVTTPSVATLRDDLTLMVNKMIGSDYKTIVSGTTDPVQKDYLTKIVNKITADMEAIYTAELTATDPNARAGLFTNLTQGVLLAQNAGAYNNRSTSGSGLTGSVILRSDPRTGRREIDMGDGRFVPFDDNNPAQVAAATGAGFNIKKTP
jgi:hypothetical protein